MTFSIVGFDPESGELGVAVASKFLAVGAFVPFARAGVGAVATQSLTNSDYGLLGLELLASGGTPEEVLRQILKNDPDFAVRQVGMVNAQGKSATFTGEKCFTWAGGIAGPNFACQGNILVGEETIKAMVDCFQAEKGHLAQRLLHALLAGDRAGGDRRGRQSAAILVVKEKAGYGGHDRAVDLRIDDHRDPIPALIGLYQLHKLYFEPPRPEDILRIDAILRRTLENHLRDLAYLQEGPVSDEKFYEALNSFQLMENFDERILENGYIDVQVVNYLEKMVQGQRG
ncbi:DUF1028 domain-containing protein [Candidatus Formimonas warabiya]|uniref:DUF1028 domain-containing protein n=1 Tax=Formimonas warabiya TaxID=1761012 RepID=UPI001F18B4DF|nr:DUF1028 domain-containing protein [Candidatus Formimonas warabiya]